MVKILHTRTWKKEKAVTLVETIVSLSIILIVSIAAVSVSIYSANAFRLSNVKRFFNHEINTIAEMYVTYNDADKFYQAVGVHTGKAVINNGAYVDTIYYLNNSMSYLDDSNGSNFYISLAFDGNTLNLSSYSNSGTELAKRSVTR